MHTWFILIKNSTAARVGNKESYQSQIQSLCNNRTFVTLFLDFSLLLRICKIAARQICSRRNCSTNWSCNHTTHSSRYHNSHGIFFIVIWWLVVIAVVVLIQVWLLFVLLLVMRVLICIFCFFNEFLQNCWSSNLFLSLLILMSSGLFYSMLFFEFDGIHLNSRMHEQIWNETC